MSNFNLDNLKKILDRGMHLWDQSDIDQVIPFLLYHEWKSPKSHKVLGWCPIERGKNGCRKLPLIGIYNITESRFREPTSHRLMGAEKALKQTLASVKHNNTTKSLLKKALDILSKKECHATWEVEVYRTIEKAYVSVGGHIEE